MLLKCVAIFIILIILFGGLFLFAITAGDRVGLWIVESESKDKQERQ